MIHGLWQSAAGLQTSQYRQAIVANNLAHAETAGFKRDLAVIRQRLVASQEAAGGSRYAHPVLDGLSGGSFVAPTYTLFEQGPLTQSANPLDLALEGEGFFAVRAGEATRYTRDGRLTLRADGTLVTSAGGHPILDSEGQTIQLQPGAGAPRIDTRGRVTQGETPVGQIGVFGFADTSVLRKVGGNLIDAGQASAENANAQVRSGTVERSNVQPTDELVRMIEVARAYQLNASLITQQDAMLGRAVNDIARV